MPDTQTTVSFLSKVPLFKSLKMSQLESLARQFVLQEYQPGQEIVTQGHGGVGLFILLSGKAEAIRIRNDGTRSVVNEFGPTDFFGELALLTEGPRTASVVAVEATQCLVLTRWNFLGTLRQDADMAITILEELAWRFRVALESL